MINILDIVIILLIKKFDCKKSKFSKVLFSNQYIQKKLERFMRKILLFLTTFFLILSSYAQVRMDVWNKNPNLSRTINKTNSKNLPKSFISKTPSGKDVIYEKLEIPEVTVETASGKKFKNKPTAYKAKTDFGVITYDGQNWSGIYTEDGYHVSNLLPDTIVEETLIGDKYNFCDGGISPPNNPKLQKSLPPTENAIIPQNAQFYDPTFRINKACSVYVEVSNRLYKYWGSSINATTNNVNIIVNNAIVVYDREGINVVLSKIYIWDQIDPYSSFTTTSQHFNLFTTNINQNIPTNPNAFFKHLFIEFGGGLGNVNGFSDGYQTVADMPQDKQIATSGMGSPIVNSNTVYSFPVMVFVHEMGHNLGSWHTQWCAWKDENGVAIGRIDSCSGVESQGVTCPPGTTNIVKSNSNGTIMSYCHINGAINLTKGFGKYPRFVIRSNLYGASQIPFLSSSIPTVTTSSVTSLTSTSCATGGIVTSDNGASVTSRGVVWSTSQNPTISLTTKTSNGTGTGTFTSNPSGLTPATIYYVRAYATNSAGTGYGSQITFTTPNFSPPVLSTNSVSQITQTTSLIQSTISLSGGSTIIARGVCWSLSQNPTITDPTTNNGTTVGSYSSNITGLSSSSRYYVRSYVTYSNPLNSGTVYGNEISFTTLSPGIISLITNSVTSIGNTSATSGGTIYGDGGLPITTKGVVWSTSQNPTISLPTKTNNGTGSGNFVSSITGLTSGVTYYVRAYATNSSGTTYGEQLIFTTIIPPSLTMTSVTGIESNKADLRFTINKAPTGLETAGVFLSATSPPISSDRTNIYFKGIIVEGEYTITTIDLLPNTRYFARALMFSSTGQEIVSANWIEFSTNSIIGTPTVITLPVTGESQGSFVVNGEVTSEGTSPVSERGIVYFDPVLNRTTTKQFGSGLGVFNGIITGVSPNATFTVKAYAKNNSGTAFGGEVLARTTIFVPEVTTSTISSITTNSATVESIVGNSGATNVIARGVCWSTSPFPTVSLTTKTSNGTGTGTFTSNITGLLPNTTYYVKAYATNSNGTGYGLTKSFTTQSTTSGPTITTTSVTSITSTSAVSGGNVTSEGGFPVTSRGVVWSTSTSPTISLTTKTVTGSGPGSFTSNITGLTQGLTYYVRAYATNSSGTNYGAQVSFVATDGTPSLTTTTVSSISPTAATSGGTITDQGSSTVTARGVCWSTSTLPTVSLTTKTNNGAGTGTFTSTLTGLSPGTLYYVRAYATNSSGTAYGNQLTFTTPTISSPTVSTSSVTTFTNTTATLGGSVTSDGGSTVTRRGVCYGTTVNPDTNQTVVNIGTGTGTFSQGVTNLNSGVLYYVRAFALNSNGISYGSQVSFQTLTTPTVTTSSAINITSTSFTSGGNVTSTGGGSLTVTDRGVCYAYTQNPTVSNTVISSGAGTGVFTSNITGLTPGVIYYVRAYATNAYGTSYGSQISVTTLASPTVTTTAASSITTTSFVSGGNVTSNGGGSQSITDRGVCYSTNTNPTISNTIVSSGTGTGTFVTTVTGLTPGTIYYARAYATNSTGTSYGNQITITIPNVPVLSTTTITSITSSSAVTGGSTISSVGSSVTTKGVCFSTSPNPTLSNSFTTNGAGTGTFVSTLSSLTPNTLYYVRAYATNSSGTGYGNQLSFTTTSSGSLASITTTDISSITQTSAVTGGNVTADGNSTVTSRGICYSTNPLPTISNTVINSGSGLGSFTTSITGLTSGFTYYVRAFATNSSGTSYGEERNFTTPNLPILTTTSASSVTSTGVTLGGTILSDGGSNITSRGVCYSTTQNPTISNSFTTDGSGTGSFTSIITGLSQTTVYYAKAYATNSVGTAYGNQVSFTTLSGIFLPTLTTTNVSSLTTNDAVSGGNITNSGSQPVTSRGVCWSTSPNPTISLSTKTSDGSGTGLFTSNITGLIANTTYYLKAYATSSVGTAYGNEISFSTSSPPSSNCGVANLLVFKPSTSWRFKWDINSNCSSYSVTASRYNYRDPNVPPPSNAVPMAIGSRLNKYVPTTTEITNGFIDQVMNPQPVYSGYWYSIEVTCNSNNCNGTKVTKSTYFYNP